MQRGSPRIEGALAAMDESWDVWSSLPERIVQVMSRMLGGPVLVYHWVGSEIVVDADNLDGAGRKAAFGRGGAARRFKMYDPNAPGADANRVVTGDELRARDPDNWDRFDDTYLRPLGLGDQLRALVTDDDGKLMSFVGVLTSRRRRAEQHQVDTFERLLRPVSERLRTWRMLAEISPDRSAILELVDELARPAFVVSEDGHVLFANLAARFVHECSRPLLPIGHLTQQSSPGLRKIPLSDGPRRIYVCLPQTNGIELERIGALAAVHWGLPPRLHATAAKLIAGHPDKQIAEETGLSHTTIRTYVQQIYRHVGVGSRTAVVREALRALGQ